MRITSEGLRAEIKRTFMFPFDHPEEWAEQKRQEEIAYRAREADKAAQFGRVTETETARALKAAMGGMHEENRVALASWLLSGFCDRCGTEYLPCYCGPEWDE